MKNKSLKTKPNFKPPKLLLKELRNKAYKIIKKPYYYVPPCPVCGSEVTGRLVRNHRNTDIEWMVDESLKNGELIQAVPELEDRNCFCVECGTEWYTDVHMQMFTLEQIKKERVKRHTADIINQRAEELRENGGGKRKGIIGLFTNFVGKI